MEVRRSTFRYGKKCSYLRFAAVPRMPSFVRKRWCLLFLPNRNLEHFVGVVSNLKGHPAHLWGGDCATQHLCSICRLATIPAPEDQRTERSSVVNSALLRLPA